MTASIVSQKKFSIKELQKELEKPTHPMHLLYKAMEEKNRAYRFLWNLLFYYKEDHSE